MNGQSQSQLQRRIDRQLLRLTVGTAVLTSLVLTVVMGAIQQRQSLQQVQERAERVERQLLEQITTGQPLTQVQRSLQITAAANHAVLALLINQQGRVIAANDGARVGERFERWMLQPIADAVWDGLWPCLVETQRHWRQRRCQQPFGQASGNRWISVSRTPVALAGQGTLQTDGLLLLSLDRRDSQSQALRTSLLSGGVGLVLVLLSCGSLVLALRQGLVRQLVRLARIDRTTGLLNRSAWMEEMPGWLADQEMQHQPILLAIAGIDGFREINSRHGYPGGDRLLRQLSRCLRSALQPQDGLARLSGDQFVLCIRGGIASLEDLRQLHSAVAAREWQAEPDQKVRLSLSIGVATSAGPAGWTLGRLLSQADRNLQLAKRQGGNQVVCR